MNASTSICFNVTPSQKETIALRTAENGFDDISAYLKVVALKTQAFTLTPEVSSAQEASIELSFDVTESQKAKIEENRESSGCKDLATYLRYVALHAVVTAVVEVRSTGTLDDMLKRIADSRKQS